MLETVGIENFAIEDDQYWKCRALEKFYDPIGWKLEIL